MVRANLKMKASKCNFANKYAKFLGHVVTRKGIKSNQEKFDTVQLYPQSILYCSTTQNPPRKLNLLRGWSYIIEDL